MLAWMLDRKPELACKLYTCPLTCASRFALIDDLPSPLLTQAIGQVASNSTQQPTGALSD
eukprot:5375412-Amphidinium_carterae.1